MSFPTDAVPLPTHLLARPKSLNWHADGNGFEAPSAVGLFTVRPLPEQVGANSTQGLWLATLNHAAFPILAPTAEDAQTLAVLAQIAHGDTVLDLRWETTNGRHHAQGIAPTHPQRPTWLVQPSQGTAGWYVLRDFQAALVPLPNKDQAMAACDQYVAYLWLALSDVQAPQTT
jgi:hypothetical protein